MVPWKESVAVKALAAGILAAGETHVVNFIQTLVSCEDCTWSLAFSALKVTDRFWRGQ